MFPVLKVAAVRYHHCIALLCSLIRSDKVMVRVFSMKIGVFLCVTAMYLICLNIVLTVMFHTCRLWHITYFLVVIVVECLYAESGDLLRGIPIDVRANCHLRLSKVDSKRVVIVCVYPMIM